MIRGIVIRSFSVSFYRCDEIVESRLALFLGPKLEKCWQKNRGNTMPFITWCQWSVKLFCLEKNAQYFFFAKIPQKKTFFFSPSPGRLRREDVERSWFRCGIPRDYDNEHCRNGNVKYENVGTQSSQKPLDLNGFKTRLWLNPPIFHFIPWRLGTQQEAFHNLDGWNSHFDR